MREKERMADFYTVLAEKHGASFIVASKIGTEVALLYNAIAVRNRINGAAIPDKLAGELTKTFLHFKLYGKEG